MYGVDLKGQLDNNWPVVFLLPFKFHRVTEPSVGLVEEAHGALSLPEVCARWCARCARACGVSPFFLLHRPTGGGLALA